MSTREFHSAGRVMLAHRSGLGTGPSFVLIHGIGMGHSYWSGLATELARSGTVYALDLPGFGDAPAPDEPLDMRGSGELIAEFVRVAGVTDPVLVGHSMGTQVAAEAAANNPELFRDVVLIAPTINQAERTVLWQVWRMLQDLSSLHPRVIWYGTVYYAKAGLGWYTKKLRTMLTHAVEETYPRIQARTLVIRGENDPVSPRGWVHRVGTLIPHATVAEVPGRGHETMITGYRAVAALIRGHLRSPS